MGETGRSLIVSTVRLLGGRFATVEPAAGPPSTRASPSDTLSAAGVPSVFTGRELAALERAAPDVVVALVPEQEVLSIGISVPLSAPSVLRARSEGVPIVRRHTGGTCIVHGHGDLLWSVILPRSDPRVGRDYTRAYPRLGAPVVTFLKGLGLDGAWVDPPGVSSEYCTLGDRGQVLAIGGEIVGGAAQHATSRALLHHGFLSWTVDRPRLDRLFGWSSPGPSERLAGLRELGIDRPGPELAHRLEQALAEFVHAAERPALDV